MKMKWIFIALSCVVMGYSALGQTIIGTASNFVSGTLTVTGKFLSSAADSITVPVFSSTQDTTSGITPRNGEVDTIVGGARQSFISQSSASFVPPITAPNYLSNQTTLTTNLGSCTIAGAPNPPIGGNGAGTFVAGGACAAGTYILGFGATASNGWSCDGEDRTTITDSVQQIASTVTNATFRATTASGDVVQWKCIGY